VQGEGFEHQFSHKNIWFSPFDKKNYCRGCGGTPSGKGGSISGVSQS